MSVEIRGLPTKRLDGTARAVLTVFGTRPELIKLAPVISALEGYADSLRSINVHTGQHRELLIPFVRHFKISVDHWLDVMIPGQTPSHICSRVLTALDSVLEKEQPDLVLVQGDTTSALAGAMAAFHRKIPVGHVEAGLRSGDRLNPFPEEMNRRLVTRLATYHFAATERNRQTLVAEGVPRDTIYLTGNPIVDSLVKILAEATPTDALKSIMDVTEGMRRIVLTTHRRESFGRLMTANLEVLRDFVSRHHDLCLIFPVHPNPEVRNQARTILDGNPRIYLTDPMDYGDFIGLMSRSWLIVSDSGGVQEEAPTLGKPVIVLRKNTERPESVEAGIARLSMGDPRELDRLLENAYGGDSWMTGASSRANPYGKGDSGRQIARVIAKVIRVGDEIIQ